MLYTMGLRDPLELDEMIQQFIDEEDVDTPADISDYSYDDILGITFKLVNSSDCYVYDREYEIWRDKTDDKEYMENLVENGEDLTIVGIVQPSEDANGLMLNAGIGYPASLTRHVAETAGDSEIVQKQLENKDINVFTGEKFGESGDQAGFDTDSLFSIDADKLQEAFSLTQTG